MFWVYLKQHGRWIRQRILLAAPCGIDSTASDSPASRKRQIRYISTPSSRSSVQSSLAKKGDSQINVVDFTTPLNAPTDNLIRLPNIISTSYDFRERNGDFALEDSFLLEFRINPELDRPYSFSFLLSSNQPPHSTGYSTLLILCSLPLSRHFRKLDSTTLNYVSEFLQSNALTM